MTTLSMPQLVVQARRAGFQGDEAAVAAAIAKAESGGHVLAHNPNASTGDNSYGLWQVNMLGGLGPERLRQFGLSRNEDLFDPSANARAAKQIRDSQGWGAWSVYKSGKYLDYLPQAQSALKDSPDVRGGAELLAGASDGGGPLQRLAGTLLNGLGSGSAGAGGATSSAGQASRPRSLVEGKRNLIQAITAGGFGGEGFGSQGSLPGVAHARAPEERMAGDRLGVAPDMMRDVLPALLTRALAPRGAGATPRDGEAGPSPSGGQAPGGAGRVVEYLTGDQDHPAYDAAHGGSNYHEHLAFGSRQERDAAMQLLKSQGIQIGSVNDGRHAATSYHYSDQAFDVPASQVPVGQERGLSRRVRQILADGGFTGIR